METTLFKVTTKDGRTFKVFCASKHQKDRFKETLNDLSDYGMTVLENGIHDIKQWEKWVDYLKTNTR